MQVVNISFFQEPNITEMSALLSTSVIRGSKDSS